VKRDAWLCIGRLSKFFGSEFSGAGVSVGWGMVIVTADGYDPKLELEEGYAELTAD